MKGMLPLLGLALATAAPAAIVTETYTDRAAFEARLGPGVRAITFDDIDTTAVDPIAFAADRYAASDGVVITGESGQYASRDFGFPSDYPVSSAPNLYAPGPIEPTIGGGNRTDVTFVAGTDPAGVAGFGVVFSDPDLPAVSSLAVFDATDALLDTVTVPDDDQALVFRGIVTVDDTTGTPVPAIARVRITNGTGWPAGLLNDGVPLDDFVFGPPDPGGVTTTTTTTVLPTTTTSTTLCPLAPATGCRAPAVSGRAMLLLRSKPRRDKNRLAWVWGKGAATVADDFGDPTATSDYALCGYDETGRVLEAAVAAGRLCKRGRGSGPCWKRTRTGFRYRDPAGTMDGVRLLRLKAGGDARARLVLIATGPAVPLPALPLAPPVTTQLVRGDGGACWEARFSTPKRNAADRFKAASD